MQDMYVYMQDNYVWMPDDYVYMQNNYAYLITKYFLFYTRHFFHAIEINKGHDRENVIEKEIMPSLVSGSMINSYPLVPHICVDKLGHHWLR